MVRAYNERVNRNDGIKTVVMTWEGKLNGEIKKKKSEV